MSSPEWLVARIRSEYHEMPGLRLTLAQACRFWHVDPVDCELALPNLVTEQFLVRTLDGAFVAIAPSSGRSVKKCLIPRATPADEASVKSRAPLMSAETDSTGST